MRSGRRLEMTRTGGQVSGEPVVAGGWRAWLGLNASTASLLAAVLLVGMGTELWSPLMPKYLDRLAAPIMLIALYGAGRDLLHGVNYLLGGAIAGRVNTRRGLLLFNALPLIGLAVLLAWQSRYAIFLALAFIGVWNSMALPAVLSVIAGTLSSGRRTMAIALQSIHRRLSMILAYGLSGALVWLLGLTAGFRAALACSVALIVLSLMIQWRFMQAASADRALVMHRPWRTLVRLDRQLKRLLVSDILVRFGQGMARELIILFALPLIGGAVKDASAFYVSVLLTMAAVTSLVTYLPMGHVASKPGLAKKPYIGMTFVFFTLFPLSLALLGPGLGRWGLVLAFLIRGLMEIGEPARKAMVVDLVHPELRTQQIGLYWTSRAAAVWPAPLVGGA
ncbi:MAG: MFS transporter, partial [Phycisphaerae bacterium]